MEKLSQFVTEVVTLNNIGSIASVFGFSLTIYVFLTIRSIKRNYLFKARVPTLQKKLQKHASTISELLRTYDESRNAILEELVLAEVNALSLRLKTSGQLKSSLKVIIKSIRKYKNASGNKEELRKIYLSLNMVIQEITNYREDDKWESNDG